MNQHNKKISGILGVSLLILVGYFLIACGNTITNIETNTPTGWIQYTEPHSGLMFAYPNGWAPNTEGDYTYFTNGEVDVLDISVVTNPGTPEQAAQIAITANNCVPITMTI
jgi:hypothetical protein